MYLWHQTRYNSHIVVLLSWNGVGGYGRFGRTCCLHLSFYAHEDVGNAFSLPNYRVCLNPKEYRVTSRRERFLCLSYILHIFITKICMWAEVTVFCPSDVTNLWGLCRQYEQRSGLIAESLWSGRFMNSVCDTELEILAVWSYWN